MSMCVWRRPHNTTTPCPIMMLPSGLRASYSQIVLTFPSPLDWRRKISTVESLKAQQVTTGNTFLFLLEQIIQCSSLLLLPTNHAYKTKRACTVALCTFSFIFLCIFSNCKCSHIVHTSQWSFTWIFGIFYFGNFFRWF